MQVRNASSVSERTDIPGIPNTSPLPPKARLDHLAPVLPDLTPRLVIRSAPIVRRIWYSVHESKQLIRSQPFVPDFWDSSKVKAKWQPEPTESSGPKVLAVAGAATHLGGGLSHNLYHDSGSTSFDSSREVSLFKREGFWHDVFSDSGLPTAVKVPSVDFESQDVPRTDSTTTRGGWTLVGLLFGSWIVAGVAAPKSEI